jgi:hypothetical protein
MDLPISLSKPPVIAGSSYHEPTYSFAFDPLPVVMFPSPVMFATSRVATVLRALMLPASFVSPEVSAPFPSLIIPVDIRAAMSTVPVRSVRVVTSLIPIRVTIVIVSIMAVVVVVRRADGARRKAVQSSESSEE